MNRRNLFKAAAVAAVAPVVPAAKPSTISKYVEPDHSGDHVHHPFTWSYSVPAGYLIVVPACQPIPEGWEVYSGYVPCMSVGRDEIVIQAKGVKRG